MINKKSLWFLTLFSLILVLSVYYITMPSELLIATNNGTKKEKTKEVVSTKEDTESAELVAQRVESEEKMLDKISELKKILTDSKATTEEKNKAFEELQNINKNRAEEEKIEKNIEKELNLKALVSIDNDKITVTVDSDKHDNKIANSIMRNIQNNFDKQVNITVNFKK
ncbi:MAG: SpoIIIAH-like family protein [Bacilli bacterium]|nr:SpoIIIAH-like family protein [Bacilli bacterium]